MRSFCVGQRTPGCVGISNVVLSEKRCDLRVSRPDAVPSPGVQVFLAEFTKTAHAGGDPGPSDLGRKLELPMGALFAPIFRVSLA